jgi:hypothetical protein
LRRDDFLCRYSCSAAVRHTHACKRTRLPAAARDGGLCISMWIVTRVHARTYSLTRSLAHSLTHSLTHSHKPTHTHACTHTHTPRLMLKSSPHAPFPSPLPSHRSRACRSNNALVGVTIDIHTRVRRLPQPTVHSLRFAVAMFRSVLRLRSGWRGQRGCQGSRNR